MVAAWTGNIPNTRVKKKRKRIVTTSLSDR